MRLARALLLALLSVPRPAAAWCRSTTAPQSDPTACVSQGVPLSWGVRCIPLALNPAAVPAGMSAAQVRRLLDDAIDTWNDVDCNGAAPPFTLWLGPDTAQGAGYQRARDTSPVVGRAPRAENVNAVVFRSDWAAAGLAPSALALTTLTFDVNTGEVVDADVMVNLAHPFTAAPLGATTNDLPTVLLHEVGHVLGLDHSNDRTAVMWSGAGRGEQRRALEGDDIAAACAAHPHWLQRPCARPAPAAGCACPAGPTRGTATLLALAALVAARPRALRRRVTPRA